MFSSGCNSCKCVNRKDPLSGGKCLCLCHLTLGSEKHTPQALQDFFEPPLCIKCDEKHFSISPCTICPKCSDVHLKYAACIREKFCPVCRETHKGPHLCVPKDANRASSLTFFPFDSQKLTPLGGYPLGPIGSPSEGKKKPCHKCLLIVDELHICDKEE